jgi:hypothetical protein
MKTYLVKNTLVITILIFGSWHCFSQGFEDLNFEDATIVQDTSSFGYPYTVYANDAIPGWTIAGCYLGTNDITYNTVSLGSTDISILGINGSPSSLDGAYSVLLYGGVTAPSASISQTGLVPANAVSILFIAHTVAPPVGGTLLVSLGGQNIPFFALSTEANYTLYGGNIPSGLAGQSEQLMLSALEGENNYWNIDDIQFSPLSVPEPSVLGLSALGGLLLAWRRWKAREI